jgi:hypothetical protein
LLDSAAVPWYIVVWQFVSIQSLKCPLVWLPCRLS